MASEKIYLLVIVVGAAWAYYWLGYQTYLRGFDGSVASLCFAILANLFLLMLGWSIISTVTTDPGKPPVFWGFFMDEPQNRRKRYCLTCHLFKPERCRHCSTCKRCVMGMDHHCPWLATCVGYYNRRFFILTLTYAALGVWTVLLFNAPKVLRIVQHWRSLKSVAQVFEHKSYLGIAFTYCVIIFLAFVITKFYIYHLRLVVNNNTTLEDLQSQRAKEPIETRFDIGLKRNIASVMGSNYLGWILPITSLPMPSDGVVWIMNEASAPAPGAQIEYVKVAQ